MSDTPLPPRETSAQAAATEAVEKAEAAATRRRWINLGEFVAIAGLIIAALSLWLSWADRHADLADKQAEKVQESHARTLVTLTGDITKDGESMSLKDDAHQVSDVQVIFPTALGLSPQSSVLGAKIASDWFGDKLLALTSHGADTRAGRLPVILAATYWDGDTKRTDRAIYSIAWQSEGRFLRGRKLRMVRLSLAARTGTQVALDALWAREKPVP
ncbi:MAG: hypothetical protein M3R41_08035 [Pseudomonadota bacterium]|nr:hypothetical protein [Pseudomonadota bacterium]